MAPRMSKPELYNKLISSYKSAPHPSFKVTNYFPIYVDLFGHLVGTSCVFIETGVLHGGSLFMWRSWLGDQARIIGIDLNPGATRWREHGFEIYIGDQGSPSFWNESLSSIGGFDALLDDGGHQSFHQIVTLAAAAKYGNTDSVVVVEDTLTSHMKEFSDHGTRSFLEFAKDSTDILSARNSQVWPGQYPAVRNKALMESYARVHSIEFFTGIVAYKLNAHSSVVPATVWNHQPAAAVTDHRYLGASKSAVVDWPDPFTSTQVTVNGKS